LTGPPAGPPRLVATDLDGTLLRSDGTISDRTVATLARVEADRAELVFVTGRPPRWLPDIAERTGHRGVAICGNGALLYDLRAGTVLEEHMIDPAALGSVVGALRRALPELGFAAEYGAEVAGDATYAAMADGRLRREQVQDVDELIGRPVAKLLARHPSLDPDTLLGQAREVVGELATVTHASTSGLIEISAAGVSKASTLAAYCAERGIDAADVVAFGDMPNDLLLLAWAGRAYAVANAHPDVLAAVTDHAPSNDDDGVAQVLEKLFGW
jgi:Cof subfamily protein (haloacid dehalogenase superfamily)